MARRTLVKFTLLAAFEGGEEIPMAHLEDLGDHLAELLRQNDRILTVASEYDSIEARVREDEELDALVKHFPSDTLPVGPVPGVKVLGRNGTFKGARLTRKDHRIELWLGTKKERFPLVVFPAGQEHNEKAT